MIILLVLMLGMFFFMNRSQKKQQQERQNLLDAMKVGDSLHGVISEINNSDKTVTLDCEGIYLIFDRASIRTVKSGVRPAAAPVEPAAVEPETTEPTEPVVEETPEDKTEENTEEK